MTMPPIEAGVQPATATVSDLRCWRCDRKLAEIVSAPWRICCPRCKAKNCNLNGQG